MFKKRLLTPLAAGLFLWAAPAFCDRDSDRDDDSAGAVFAGTNHNNSMDSRQPANQVLMYMRASNGSLTLVGAFNTGGQGSGPSKRFAGDGLGSSHSVQLSTDHKWLFVTNAGSNTVSVFRVVLGNGHGMERLFRNGLVLTDVQSTGDGSKGHRFPNSVTQSGDLVYVLNSADQGSVSGFRLSAAGKLTPIPHSTRDLNANQTYPPDTLFNPAQVSFTPDGKRLLLTIKDGPLGAGVTPTGPGRVLVFSVGSNGLLSNTGVETDLNNHGPFGFSFDRDGNPLFALFVGGPMNSAAAGSFRIKQDGSLVGITPDVPDTQLDTCWLENNGKFAFGANYSSGTISSFIIGGDGHLVLLDAQAGLTQHGPNPQGSTPLDIRVSPDGNFVYDVLPGTGKVAAWAIQHNGKLKKIGEYSGLPITVYGDMAPEERFGPGGSPAGIDVI